MNIFPPTIQRITETALAFRRTHQNAGFPILNTTAPKWLVEWLRSSPEMSKLLDQPVQTKNHERI